MESTTVRTDFIKNEKGEHQIIRTTMTVKRADEKDETVSDELHTTEETVAYEPAPKPVIDQSSPCTRPGRPATDNVSNWIDDSGGVSAARNWPSEIR